MKAIVFLVTFFVAISSCHKTADWFQKCFDEEKFNSTILQHRKACVDEIPGDDKRNHELVIDCFLRKLGAINEKGDMVFGKFKEVWLDAVKIDSIKPDFEKLMDKCHTNFPRITSDFFNCFEFKEVCIGIR